MPDDEVGAFLSEIDGNKSGQDVLLRVKQNHDLRSQTPSGIEPDHQSDLAAVEFHQGADGKNPTGMDEVLDQFGLEQGTAVFVQLADGVMGGFAGMMGSQRGHGFITVDQT